MSMPTPSPYADWKKDGLTTIIKAARFLCGLVNQFGGIIKSKYADNPAIVALVIAAETLCAALPAAQAEFDAIPSDDPLPPSDPSTTPGIDTNAPEAPDPADTGV